MLIRPHHYARLRALALLATLGPLVACGQADQESHSADQPPAAEDIDPALKDRCKRTVEHVTMLIQGGPGGGISPRETAIIDATAALSVASCEREGLSPAQEACLLGIKNALNLADAAKCPAIAEKKPSWLILPPTAAEQEAILEAYRASIEKDRKAEASDHGDHVADGDKDE